jgi:hypothetical protein
VLYLFLGNANLQAAQIAPADSAERTEWLAAARQAYERARTLNPHYARSWNGLGTALLQLARPALADGDECNWDWDVLADAQAAYESAFAAPALAAPAEAKPESGYVDLRAHTGLGQTHYWRAWCVDPDEQDAALAQYQQAMALYGALPPDRQALLAWDGAVIHLGLGRLAPTAGAALPDLVAVLELSQKAGTEELARLALDAMPLLLTAYCEAGQAVQGRAALDAFAARQPAPAASRTVILDRLAEDTRAACYEE